jgi:glutamate 5-kinase
VHALAGGAGSSLGTGGMATKIRAAEITMEQNIPCCIISGDDPALLYDLLDGADIGTVFAAE